MSIPHIVIVEDNLPDVMIFREALARRGIAFTIEHFADGEQAGDEIARITTPPDLFVLDLNLPRVDGLSLLRQIREREVTTRTPVAVLTTSRAPADRTRCEALGADAFIVKPAGFTEFLDVVSAAVQRLLNTGDATHARVGDAQRSVTVNSPARERILRLASILRRARRREGGKARAAQSPE